jgi:hypothetical protein
LTNDDVLNLLDMYKQAAVEHGFDHIAICMVRPPGILGMDWCGNVALREMQLEALLRLAQKLQKSIDNDKFPDPDPTLDQSYVRYNVCTSPLGFDFLVWLVTCEMNRIRHKAPAPLKVAFWEGKGEVENLNRERRDLWLTRVFRPLLPLIGAVEAPEAVGGHHIDTYVSKDIVDACRRGEHVPRLKSKTPCANSGHVTITLRELFDDTRNSTTQEWLRFADALKAEGEQVIVVRDTRKAFEALPGYTTYPTASLDVDVRLGLYEKATMNFFVENGPQGLCWFSDAPWMSFHQIDESHNANWLRSRWFWQQNVHINPGEQFPWSSPDQRLVWQADTYENILSAWREWNVSKNRKYGDLHANGNGGYHGFSERDDSEHPAGRNGEPDQRDLGNLDLRPGGVEL